MSIINCVLTKIYVIMLSQGGDDMVGDKIKEYRMLRGMTQGESNPFGCLIYWTSRAVVSYGVAYSALSTLFL